MAASEDRPVNPKTKIVYTDLQIMAKIDKLLPALQPGSLEWLSERIRQIYIEKTSPASEAPQGHQAMPSRLPASDPRD